jgi:hypothetical protein
LGNVGLVGKRLGGNFRTRNPGARIDIRVGIARDRAGKHDIAILESFTVARNSTPG